MKKKSIISLLLLVSLSFQTAYPLFEGVKQRAVSVKEAMSKARVALRENWQCLVSGTGPNCTKEQRKALVIIHDFVTGKWNAARKKLKQFEKGCEIGCSMSISIVVVMLFVLLLAGGVVAFEVSADRLADLRDAKEYFKAEKEDSELFQKLKAGKISWTDEFAEKIIALPKIFKKIQYSWTSAAMIKDNMIQSQALLDEVGWGSTYQGENFIVHLLGNRFLSNADKIEIAEWLQQKGVMPTESERAEIELLRPHEWQTPFGQLQK